MSIDKKFEKLLRRKQSRKYLNQSFILTLINVTNDEKMKKRYWNTFHCGSLIDVVESNAIKITDFENGQYENAIKIKKIKHSKHTISKDGEVREIRNYCNNRFCLVCSGIKSSVLFSKYGKIIESWENKHFLTLTVPNCIESDLENTINKMLKAIRKINDKYRKQAKKYNLEKLKSIRKLEITYNERLNSYHPHLHFIFYNKDQAEYILKNWLIIFNEANEKAQDLRKADEKSVFELFKYITKLITKQSNKYGHIPARNLDVIFRVMHNRRSIQIQGFKALKIDLEKGEELMQEIIINDENYYLEEYEKMFYEWKNFGDWINSETGELLVGDSKKISSYKMALSFKNEISENGSKNTLETKEEKKRKLIDKNYKEYKRNLEIIRSKNIKEVKK